MKKTVKILAAVILLAVVCMSFSGCTLIDEMRASQVIDKGQYLTLGEDTFVKIPYCSFLYPDFYGKNSKTVTITEEDVPVLASTMFGLESELSADGNFIRSNDWYSTVAEGNVMYCKESVKDEVMKIMESGITTNTYKYEVYNYDIGWYIDRILTVKENETLDKAAKEGKVLGGEDPFEYWDAVATINAYVEGLPFENFRYEITSLNGKYYIKEMVIPEGLEGADKENYIYDQFDAEYVWKKVPEKYNSVFEKIMDKIFEENEGVVEYY
ncbi:MAG: hypothetical protein Q4D44_06695 [Eubacteriales bacterium]|nr:hypothetical protein [Eubacteriales bacterium]